MGLTEIIVQRLIHLPFPRSPYPVPAQLSLYLLNIKNSSKYRRDTYFLPFLVAI